MSIIIGCASTKQTKKLINAVLSTRMSFYTRYLPAIPVATEPVGVACASARFPFFAFSVPKPIEPAPGEGSWSGTLAKVWV
jgi:hypothetical protein